MLLRRITPEGTEALNEHLRAAIKATKLAAVAPRQFVVSFGIAYRDSGLATKSIRMERTDKALCKAKCHDRSHMVVALP